MLFQNSDSPSQADPVICPHPIPCLESTAYCRLLKGTVLPETQDCPTSNSSMTTKELQEHWQKEKSRWRHVKLLFEIASARIEERRVSKFVVSRA